MLAWAAGRACLGSWPCLPRPLAATVAFMKAVVITTHGGPEVLQVQDVPEPEFGPDEVLVDVAFSAMNRADLLQRMGLYPAPGPKPTHEIPGLEFAGKIAAIGSRVPGPASAGTGWAVGDEVMGILPGGAMAQQAVTHERMLQRVPATVNLDQAAAIPEVFMTAHDALVVQGGLRPGAKALVHAGASGVGTAAIQICKAIGAQVAVTCSASKMSACADLGADLVIDYASQDFAQEIASWTNGRGVNVVLDVIGGDYLKLNIDSLAVQGRIIQVGVMSPEKASFSLGMLLPKRAALIGTVLRSRPIEQKIEANQRFVSELLGFFDSGVLRPVVDSTYPLAQIAAAHEYMATNANVGKILIAVA